MIPRGVRNNNPGNIEYHESIPWRGQTGSDGRFATFDTAHNGLRALAKQLLVYEDKYGLRTVRGIINRWAPPVENNTSAYVNAVAAALGVGPDDVISTHGPRTLAGLVTAIVQHENGQQPYTVPQITAAVADALGAESTVGVTKPQTVDKTTQNASSFAHDPVPQTVQPKKVGMDPLTLVSMLSGVFAPLIRSKLDKALGSDIGKPLADNLIAMAQTATGKTDPLEAVAVARQNPETVKKLEAAAEDWLSQVAPLMDKIDAYERGAWAASEDSMDRAAVRAQKMQDAGLLRNPQFLIAAFILIMVAGVVFTVLYKDTFSSDMQSFVIGAIVGSALTAVISFFFGTSRSSAAKDVVIGELASRK